MWPLVKTDTHERCACRVYPGEGTHSDFAPRGEKQRKLLEFVERELGYCEIEHVGGGSGLERIYQVRHGIC